MNTPHQQTTSSGTKIPFVSRNWNIFNFRKPLSNEEAASIGQLTQNVYGVQQFVPHNLIKLEFAGNPIPTAANTVLHEPVICKNPSQGGQNITPTNFTTFRIVIIVEVFIPTTLTRFASSEALEKKTLYEPPQRIKAARFTEAGSCIGDLSTQAVHGSKPNLFGFPSQSRMECQVHPQPEQHPYLSRFAKQWQKQNSKSLKRQQKLRLQRKDAKLYPSLRFKKFAKSKSKRKNKKSTIEQRITELQAIAPTNLMREVHSLRLQSALMNKEFVYSSSELTANYLEIGEQLPSPQVENM